MVRSPPIRASGPITMCSPASVSGPSVRPLKTTEAPASRAAPWTWPSIETLAPPASSVPPISVSGPMATLAPPARRLPPIVEFTSTTAPNRRARPVTLLARLMDAPAAVMSAPMVPPTAIFAPTASMLPAASTARTTEAPAALMFAAVPVMVTEPPAARMSPPVALIVTTAPAAVLPSCASARVAGMDRHRGGGRRQQPAIPSRLCIAQTPVIAPLRRRHRATGPHNLRLRIPRGH